LDGTNDEIGSGRPTNVAKVFEMLDLDDPTRQIAYYDPGVGTLPAPDSHGQLGHEMSRLTELAFGVGLTANLAQAYGWLMQNFQLGDQVYIFGFSRGAFTARGLAGILGRPGLLRSGSQNLVDYAVKAYDAHHDEFTGEAAINIANFADALCWGTPDHPMTRAADSAAGVADVHALPIAYCGLWDTVDASGFLGHGGVTWPYTRDLPNVRHIRHAVSIDERRRPYHEFLFNPRDGLDEAWFAGVHCDVGGTFDDCRLATIALKWVFDGACHQLLLRDRNVAQTYGRYCTVQESDATAPIHVMSPAWRAAGVRTRPIPDTALLHDSVRLRRHADPDYLPDLHNAEAADRYTDTDWCTPRIA
jgi:uncharacterized protein (DUF2235 family)